MFVVFFILTQVIDW